MSANESKLYTFKEREWVVTGWAEGQMETEREDDKGQKVTEAGPSVPVEISCSSFPRSAPTSLTTTAPTA